MSARILALRPDGVISHPGAAAAAEIDVDPACVLAYLRGLEAGDRHGYARGRGEALADLGHSAWAWLTGWAVRVSR